MSLDDYVYFIPYKCISTLVGILFFNYCADMQNSHLCFISQQV